MGPISPYELKAGTVIPAIMVGGINSDLPGQILGQVRENVYDTATGRHILIPQGSKLVGTYDNAITTGQERVLVAWTRIIYPDSSSIDLGKMPGAECPRGPAPSPSIKGWFPISFSNHSTRDNTRPPPGRKFAGLPRQAMPGNRLSSRGARWTTIIPA